MQLIENLDSTKEIEPLFIQWKFMHINIQKYLHTERQMNISIKPELIFITRRLLSVVWSIMIQISKLCIYLQAVEIWIEFVYVCVKCAAIVYVSKALSWKIFANWMEITLFTWYVI